MLTLAKAVVQGSPAVLNMVKSMITNPTLISESPKWAVSLEAESCAKRGEAEVSQCPVIVPGTGVRQFLSDNVAPKPKTWNLSGYIPGNRVLEPSNYFTPVVMANVAFLWQAFQRGSRLIFKDMDMIVYKRCVISSLETHFDKECRNKMPFSMTLQEITEIDASVSELTETEIASTPDGGAVDMGTTSATEVGEKVRNSYAYDGAENIGLIP